MPPIWYSIRECIYYKGLKTVSKFVNILYQMCLFGYK